jgi:hypothetical protein
VPWCDACDRFLSPSTVEVDGTCPACGRVVDPGHAHAPVPGPGAPVPAAKPAVDDDEELPPIPWHLWLLAAALAVYLGYRAMQGIEWLLGTVVPHVVR